MKRTAVIMMLACAMLAFGTIAAEPAKPAQKTNGDWTFFQLGFIQDVPSDMLTVAVYGFKLGAPVCNGAPVYGLEAAVFYANSCRVTGIQGSLIAANAEQINGVQLGLLNFVKHCSGVQIGIFNAAEGNTFQVGLLNYVKDGACPWLPLVNFKF